MKTNLNKYFTLNIKYFCIGLITILIVNYSTFLGEKNEASTSDTGGSSIEIVTLGEIKESIDVVGDAELVDEQSLTFNKEATVTDVYFKAGDSIKKGEVIARIDDSDAYDDIEEAKISLENAKISLNQLYEEEDESKISQAENTITTSQNSLDIAKKELENLKTSQATSLDKMQKDIETSRKELDNLKESLELSQKELETFIKEKEDSYEGTEVSKNSVITDIELDFKTYIAKIEEIIQEADYILGVTDENKDENDEYENFLGAKNTGIKDEAETSLRESISKYEEILEVYGAYDYTGNIEQIEELLELNLVIFNKLYEVADLVYKTAENSIESDGSLSESDIDSIKNKMSSYRTDSLSKVNSIENSKDDLTTLTDTDLVSESNDNSIASKDDTVKSQELSVEKKEIELENEIKEYNEKIEEYKVDMESKTQDIASKELSLSVSKINLEELLEGPTADNVTKSKNSIRQAEIRLAAAYEDLEDYTLTAPFDGLITKVDYMPGDNLKNENDMYVYIENPNLLEVTVMLDQIDIVQVEIGDAAIVTFDAYITTPVDAKISNIDTTPVKNSGVVSYEVRLILDDPDFDKKILSGMTSDVEIINELKENILLLKTSAITTVGDKKMVNVQKNGSIEKIEIETGLSSDGMTEIISGLNEGDKVIVGDFSIGTEEEESTLFETPGAGKGQGGQRPQ